MSLSQNLDVLSVHPQISKFPPERFSRTKHQQNSGQTRIAFRQKRTKSAQLCSPRVGPKKHRVHFRELRANIPPAGVRKASLVFPGRSVRGNPMRLRPAYNTLYPVSGDAGIWLRGVAIRSSAVITVQGLLAPGCR